MAHIAWTLKQIGEIVRRRRLEAKQSQSERGKRAGLRQGMISQIEHGNKATQVGSVCLALAALGLEMVITDRSRGSAQDIENMF